MIKQLLLRVLPGPAGALQTARQRRHIRRFECRLGLPQLAQSYRDKYGLTVAAGPFAEMTYVPRAVGSAFIPKLLGSYEEELHGVIEQVSESRYANVIDVGCAEGYYAVGMALRLPNSQVYAFDTDARARILCREMARVNGVADRVTVAGKCDTEVLDKLLMQRSLIICDCEGYEMHLLCPDRVRGMDRADILVELHDFMGDAVTETILARYRNTHDIQLITSVERDSERYPRLAIFPVEERRTAVSEFRPSGQQWAFMKAKNSG